MIGSSTFSKPSSRPVPLFNDFLGPKVIPRTFTKAKSMARNPFVGITKGHVQTDGTMNSPSRGPAGYSVLGSHGTPISYVLSSSELSLEMRDHGYQLTVSKVLKPRIAIFYDGKIGQTFLLICQSSLGLTKHPQRFPSSAY